MNSWNKKLIKLIWVTFLSFFTFLTAIVFFISIDLFGLFGDIPSFEILENPQKDLATSIYSNDGVLMGKYFDRENRVDVSYHEISKHVIKALIATEDERFEEHSGIDLRALGRVFKGIITANSSLGGGSTITQQVAKNLFKMRKEPQYLGSLYRFKLTRSLSIKLKEWITAIRLERSYSKRELITMYLNTVEFGSRSYGIHAASKTFFNKKPKDLKVEEAAVLVGALKATSRYNPKLNQENSFGRRNVVMSQMKKYGFLSEHEYDSLHFLPLTLDYHPENYNEGIAPYFRSFIKKSISKWCKENGYDLYRSGLKIHTSIDSRIQLHAKNAANRHMKQLQHIFQNDWGNKPMFDNNYLIQEIKKTPYYKELKNKYHDYPDSINFILNEKKGASIFTWSGVKDTSISFVGKVKHHKKFLHTGLVSIDPYSREIKAWVGGINHELFPLDHINQTKRQPGSTFKPIVYSTAINSGYSPCSTFPDVPVTIKANNGSFWQPKGTKYSGDNVSLKIALARSMNNVSAKLMEKVGPENVVEHAHNLGIKSDLNPVLSLALGTSDVSVLEMTNSYSTFVNKGIYKEPIYIKRIEDKNGKVLAEFSNDASSKEVMSPQNAYKIVSMLRGSTIIRNGTATRLNSEYNLLNNNNEIGGKTGTTQNSTDGWFMGITKDLVTGCWVGGDDCNIHFQSGYYGQGSRMAMPIFGILMQSLYNDSKSGIQKGVFPLPSIIDDTFIQSITCEETFKADTTLLSNEDNKFENPEEL